jgi:broad specificity phosphatase PhoE
VTTVPSKETSALIAKLRDSHGNVLVVGHGNTIPDLIKEVGVAVPISISENDYDNLFVLVLDEKPRLIRLHYP